MVCEDCIPYYINVLVHYADGYTYHQPQQNFPDMNLTPVCVRVRVLKFPDFTNKQVIGVQRDLIDAYCVVECGPGNETFVASLEDPMTSANLHQ
ncbi:hypothetical protein C5167_039052 [Papaver somniferum]|uniref:Uncharacterized protein n=1 Tax=Papaver somniferum TaxID=3469 RepID=A0A4Y7IEG0_PAPSO|nr:hypothetical protein C5167_039052 [Papaver somniferum]